MGISWRIVLRRLQIPGKNMLSYLSWVFSGIQTASDTQKVFAFFFSWVFSGIQTASDTQKKIVFLYFLGIFRDPGGFRYPEKICFLIFYGDRYVYRDDTDTLCMRVESVYQGLSNEEDGKIYVKMDDEEDVTISPQIYDPLISEDTGSSDAEESEEKNEDSKNEDPTSHSSGLNSYQAILDEYTAKMNNAVSGLIQEYSSEASGITDITRLAEICNNKVEKLAEICNEGVGEMAELMYANSDSYDTYENWAGKLMDNYSNIASEIQNAYIDSPM